VNLDETGFNQQRDPDPPPLPTDPPATAEAPAETNKLGRGWLWVAACPTAIVFLIRRSRASQVVKNLLGSAFAGRITTDRWQAYNWFDIGRRQLC